MSIRPAHYGIQVEFRTFLDYYNYCENTPVLKPELPLVAYRGYHTTAEPARRLDKLAQEWDALCAKQSARCLPVPRTW
ncbi:MAG: hypothetical protein GX620_02710 [Chloroflexi bacterium]|nr:hypothetical protein [Chloroflexota bacterium]